MGRVRAGAPPPSEIDNDSPDDDVFSAFSRKRSKKKKSRSSSIGNVFGKKAKISHQSSDVPSTTTTTTTTSSPPPSSSSSPNGKDSSSAVAVAAAAKEGESSMSGSTSAAMKADTSSNKRHHMNSSKRAAKMDALLQELKETSNKPKDASSSSQQQQQSHDADLHYSLYNRPLPEKMGSYVLPGEEYVTTNIFVGNLSPLTTEEEVTDVFRQFGDLYSVKIMWPRTAEERARGRNTGFVCFMSREDAEEAMDAYNDSDPLNTGHRLSLRWGKNVKKSVKRGTGGVPIPPIRRMEKKSREGSVESSSMGRHARAESMGGGEKGKVVSNDTSNQLSMGQIQGKEMAEKEPGTTTKNENTTQSGSNESSTEKTVIARIPKYDPSKHTNVIRVTAPSDPHRLKFITIVANWVSKDGSILEDKLKERQVNNPEFSFLNDSSSTLSPEQIQEQIFYRWRVFAFTQGDGFDSWRTEPFVMIEPSGMFWIPPSLNTQAALREEMMSKQKEENIRAQKEHRRKLAGLKKDYQTGRQLEHAKFGGVSKGSEGGARLNEYELEQWLEIINHKLCASRDSICKAMSFCFDKSSAARHISGLLKESLLDTRVQNIDTRIARLYLLSDVLFNSQQPGVKNAFRYRDAIENMAPEIFRCLGQHGDGNVGRMTMNKLRSAVSAVLNAWTNWSVYNSDMIDDLFDLFEGRDPSKRKKESSEEANIEEEKEGDGSPSENLSESNDQEKHIDDKSKEGVEESENPTKTMAPRSQWVDAADEEEEEDTGELEISQEEPEEIPDDIDGESLSEGDLDGLIDEDDLDGEAMDEDD